MKSRFQYVGELPAGGDWRFLLVQIDRQPDVVLIVDKTGQHAPRMVIDDKLVEVQP